MQEVLVELNRQNQAKQDFISPAQGMRLREDGQTFEINHLMANRNSPIITVIPMSSKLKKLELPVHIPVTGRDCEMLRDEGLEESILLVEQITTIDKMVLCNRLCRVTSARKKQEIEAAVKKQFAMQACMGREAQA